MVLRGVDSCAEIADSLPAAKVLEGGKLAWKQGVKIIPTGMSPSHFTSLGFTAYKTYTEHSPTLYWADEVRVSPSSDYLYASTRGLEPETKGWFAVFRLLPSGLVESDTPLALWETPTSGGWANAVEPAPSPLSTLRQKDGKDYLALTDSEEGLVLVLSWDGEKVEEVARTKLEGKAGAATAVWLD